jgi:carboxymethylenebutenolidase
MSSIALLLLCISSLCQLNGSLAFSSWVSSSIISSWSASVAHIIEHVASPPLQIRPLSDLTNIRIPGPDGIDILAYRATSNNDDGGNAIILLHEFFGLNPSIVEKADLLAKDLGCTVIAPDTFRGTVTDFVPKAIWLALTTPQDRVNDDLDAVCRYLGFITTKADSGKKLAVVGFCYGGGKAIRYTTHRQPDAATVLFYGSPVTDVKELKQLNAPVCGIFGDSDAQFPSSLLHKFQSSLNDAGVDNDVRVYKGVGHAFWKDVSQIERGDQPQADAYDQCTTFLREFFSSYVATKAASTAKGRFLESLDRPYDLNQGRKERTGLLNDLIQNGDGIQRPGSRESFMPVAPGRWRVIYAPHMTTMAGLAGGEFSVQYDLNDDGTIVSHAKCNFPFFKGFLSVSGSFSSVNNQVCRVDFDEAWVKATRFDANDEPYPNIQSVPDSVLKSLIRTLGKAAFIEAFAVFPISFLDSEMIVFDFELLGTRICARKEQ